MEQVRVGRVLADDLVGQLRVPESGPTPSPLSPYFRRFLTLPFPSDFAGNLPHQAGSNRG